VGQRLDVAASQVHPASEQVARWPHRGRVDVRLGQWAGRQRAADLPGVDATVLGLGALDGGHLQGVALPQKTIPRDLGANFFCFFDRSSSVRIDPSVSGGDVSSARRRVSQPHSLASCTPRRIHTHRRITLCRGRESAINGDNSRKTDKAFRIATPMQKPCLFFIGASAWVNTRRSPDLQLVTPSRSGVRYGVPGTQRRRIVLPTCEVVTMDG